jgi:hypothetical protein
MHSQTHGAPVARKELQVIECTEVGIKGLKAHYCPSVQERYCDEMFVYKKSETFEVLKN